MTSRMPAHLTSILDEWEASNPLTIVMLCLVFFASSLFLVLEQYYGLIRNRIGIEAWAKKMITDCYPDTRDVKMVTNRTRDHRDD